MRINKIAAAGFFILELFTLITVKAQVSSAAIKKPGTNPHKEIVEFKLATVLQSDMVIQQGKPFKVWGKAPAGDTIIIKSDWNKNVTLAISDRNNRWQGQISVPAARSNDFSPHTLIFTHKNSSVKLKNILIGEVWLCSGQSNMDMELKPFLPWLQGVIDYEKEIAAANYPAIRLINIRTDFKAEPQEEAKGTWKICTPENAKDFSGVAYYFARKIHNELKVPVGLVVPCVGGSGAQAYTSREVLSSDPVLKEKYLDPYDNSPVSKEKLDSVVTFEKLVRPTLLYNAMIHPLKNISIHGFLWYQGESNKDDKGLYTRLNTAMIEGWRKDFNQGNLPFYFVQVAPYNWEQNDSTAYNYAIFREAQEAILQKTKNAGMVVTMDVGEANDIHPRNKKAVGERLAFIALNNTYGFKNIVYQGPKFSKFKVDKGYVKVSFVSETIGSGLMTSDNRPPRHFYLAGEDKLFHLATAKIVNNQIWLQSEKVKNPVAIRYAFTNYPITNTANKEGLPMVPFRTDSWE